jgi:RNase adaptor protein for sRNA GlmZ degradation
MKILVYSFSYHHTLDRSNILPNKGGHEFDCRGLPNPGLEDYFKDYSGLSERCLQYFRDCALTENFIKLCQHFIDNSISLHRLKSYESLSVGFGCTGGQHRSVYCSSRINRYIDTSFPDIFVELQHLRLPYLKNIIE